MIMIFKIKKLDIKIFFWITIFGVIFYSFKVNAVDTVNNLDTQSMENSNSLGVPSQNIAPQEIKQKSLEDMPEDLIEKMISDEKDPENQIKMITQLSQVNKVFARLLKSGNINEILKKFPKIINNDIFIKSVKYNVPELVKIFLNLPDELKSKHPEIKANQKKGSLLLTAVENNFLEVAKLLLMSSSKDEWQSSGRRHFNYELLQAAIHQNNFKMIELLLENGIKVNSYFVATSIRDNQFNLFKLLLNKGNVKDPYMMLFSDIILYARFEMLKLLLDKINYPDEAKQKALLEANGYYLNRSKYHIKDKHEENQYLNIIEYLQDHLKKTIPHEIKSLKLECKK